MIREVIRTKRMPPYDADPHVGKFSDDRRLSAEETGDARPLDRGRKRRAARARTPGQAPRRRRVAAGQARHHPRRPAPLHHRRHRRGQLQAPLDRQPGSRGQVAARHHHQGREPPGRAPPLDRPDERGSQARQPAFENAWGRLDRHSMPWAWRTRSRRRMSGPTSRRAAPSASRATTPRSARRGDRPHQDRALLLQGRREARDGDAQHRHHQQRHPRSRRTTRTTWKSPTWISLHEAVLYSAFIHAHYRGDRVCPVDPLSGRQGEDADRRARTYHQFGWQQRYTFAEPVTISGQVAADRPLRLRQLQGEPRQPRSDQDHHLGRAVLGGDSSSRACATAGSTRPPSTWSTTTRNCWTAG